MLPIMPSTEGVVDADNLSIRKFERDIKLNLQNADSNIKRYN